jgi:cyclohexadienyl dehydratase
MKNALLIVLCVLSLVTRARGHADRAGSVITPSRLDEVIARRMLRVCTTGDFRPYSLLKPDGQFEGIDIDLTLKLARSLDVKVEFVRTSWSRLLTDFKEKCDLAVGGISTTLERQREAFLTDPYIADGKTPIARCKEVDKYQTIAQIDGPGTRVIVNPGGTNEFFARRYFQHASLTVYAYNLTIFQQILANKADVMVTDVSETLIQQKLNPGLCSVHPDKPLVYGEKAFMVPRGDVTSRNM